MAIYTVFSHEREESLSCSITQMKLKDIMLSNNSKRHTM